MSHSEAETTSAAEQKSPTWHHMLSWGMTFTYAFAFLESLMFILLSAIDLFPQHRLLFLFIFSILFFVSCLFFVFVQFYNNKAGKLVFDVCIFISMMIVIGFLFFSDDNKGLAEEPPIPSVVPISTLTPIPSPSYIALTDTPMPSPTQNGITYPQLTATVVARTTQSHEATVNAALTRVSNDSATETASSVAATLTAIYSQGVLDEQNTATARAIILDANTCRIRVINGSVNLRSNPSDLNGNGNIMQVLPQDGNQFYNVIGRTSGIVHENLWWEIQLSGGVTGWVHSSVVEESSLIICLGVPENSISGS